MASLNLFSHNTHPCILPKVSSRDEPAVVYCFPKACVHDLLHCCFFGNTSPQMFPMNSMKNMARILAKERHSSSVPLPCFSQ